MTARSLIQGRRGACTALLASLMLGACANAEVTRYHRFTDDAYSLREEPARVLPGAPRDLSDEGYVLLGHLEVRQPIRTCEKTQCWDYTHDQAGRDTAVQLAARRGGDVILLSKDGALEREVGEREGRCKLPTYAPGSIRPRRMAVMPGSCIEYEAIPRVRELLVTEGYVWRHEPGRVSRASRALWRRWFEEGKSQDAASPEPSPDGTPTADP